MAATTEIYVDAAVSTEEKKHGEEMADAATATATATTTTKDHPQAFLCPITLEVMKDPVMDCDGNTYERENILKWMKKHPTSPITRNPLKKKHLVPNRALREMIYRVMGSEWVRQAEKSIKEVPVDYNPLRQKTVAGGSSTAATTNTTNNNSNNRDYRGTVDGYLEEISRAVGKNIRLNHQGICAFTYQHLTIVIEVPLSVGNFFIYSSFFNPVTHPAPTTEIYKKALRLNYLQQETRGACLGLDKNTNELILSYTDRVNEINSRDFRNILENFIDTAMKLEKDLKSTGGGQAEATASDVGNGNK